VLFVSYSAVAQQNAFALVTKKSRITIVYDKDAPALDSIAAHLLAEDIERVTGYKPNVLNRIDNANGSQIILGEIQSTLIKEILGASPVIKKLEGKWESFAYTTINKPSANSSKALVIAGSDPRGTAYGVFTLSEKIGVSPWYWWADVPVKQQQELIINQPEFISSQPAVKFRGIFINDEDWGLQPWAAKTLAPKHTQRFLSFCFD
jgi:hypothetical protein